MIRHPLILVAIAISGCTGTVIPATKVEIQRVEVPIPVRREAPPELMTCADHITPPAAPPMLVDVAGGLLIPTAEIPKLTQLAHDDAEARRQSTSCDEAWRAWATSP